MLRPYGIPAMDWDSDYIRKFVAGALEEDGAESHAVAATLLPRTLQVRAQIIAEANCVCAGLPLIERIFRKAEAGTQIELLAQDGHDVRRSDCVMELRGSAASILGAEGTALSLLKHLSSIAMKTRRFAEEVRGTRSKVCGTSETTPGMRGLEQYAIELGGGTVHQANDILLTTNHVRLAGGVKAALDEAHSLVALQLRPQPMTAYEATGEQPNALEADAISVKIEVQDEGELREALDAGAEFVILKNVRLEDAGHCVQVIRDIRPEVTVQIDGEITMANVRAYAETGADYLSCQELRHPTPRTRFNLLVEQREEK